jgi:hypothetical protein
MNRRRHRVDMISPCFLDDGREMSAIPWKAEIVDIVSAWMTGCSNEARSISFAPKAGGVALHAEDL